MPLSRASKGSIQLTCPRALPHAGALPPPAVSPLEWGLVLVTCTESDETSLPRLGCKRLASASLPSHVLLGCSQLPGGQIDPPWVAVLCVAPQKMSALSSWRCASGWRVALCHAWLTLGPWHLTRTPRAPPPGSPNVRAGGQGRAGVKWAQDHVSQRRMFTPGSSLPLSKETVHTARLFA